MRLLVLSAALAAVLTICNASLASVTYTEDHKFLVQDGIVENWVAKANLTHKYYETGYVSYRRLLLLSRLLKRPVFSDSVSTLAICFAGKRLCIDIFFYLVRAFSL